MYRLASASRHLRSFIASATPRWCPPALARRVPPRFAAADPPTRHDSRFPHGSRNMANSSGLKGEELDKPGRQPVDPSFKDFISSLGKLSAGTQGMKNVQHIDRSKELITRHSYVPPANSAEDERRASRNAISGNKYPLTTTLEVIDNKPDITGEIVGTADCELSSESWAGEMPGHDEPIYEYILPDSSHRDGSIHRDTQRGWKRIYCIADRSETQLEATMFSDPIGCIIHNGTCMSHRTRHMLQIFSLRLAKITAEHGSVELYGYIAARDRLEPLLNYVVNFSRDDPIIVEQGSLINMAGPKRGIQLVDTTLIEYDMKIKTGKHEDEEVAHNRCWTADRLAKRGLPHPERCLLCDQAEETIDHLLISCVFARQVWYSILQQVGLQALSPQPENNSFDEWWASTNMGISDQIKKGLNSIIILGAWSIWNHRNRCVFDGIQPNLNEVLVLLRDELHLWSVAGARGISNLLALAPANG